MAALLGAQAGCVKSSSEAAVGADGATTIKLSVGYKVPNWDKIRAAPDDCTCWRVYQIHKDSLGAARRAIADFEAAFDARKLTERWTQLGLVVSKAAVSDRGEWRTIEVEATAANVTDVRAKLATALKAAGPDEYLTALPWYLHTRKLLPRLPRFQKTADPAVVKVTIPVADVGSEIADLAEMDEQEREKLKRQLTYMRALRAFDDGSLSVRVKLPGTIVSVENAKQEGTDVVVFGLEGPSIDPEALSSQARAKGQITATLRIDPATFKIPLEDA
jgi:hypothetical protein